MLVLPLERIFNTIRRNAAEIIAALGDAELEALEAGDGKGARGLENVARAHPAPAAALRRWPGRIRS